MSLRTAAIVTAIAVLFFVAGQAILVVTAGAFLAIFLNATTELTMRMTALRRGSALTMVLLVMTLLLVWFGLLVGPEVALQISQLGAVSAAVIGDLQENLMALGWGSWQDADWQGAMERLFTEAFNIFGHITGVASTTVQIVGAVIVIGFIGLYGAAEPGIYRRGVVLLFPVDRRDRIDAVLLDLGATLGRWLFARVLSMIFAGVLTWIGLVALEIPLALTLAVLATALTFIPYLGPIMAAIPAIIVALGEGMTTAAYVFLLYVLVQTLEGYIITPLLLRRTVAMPPALTLATQIIMGVVFGFMGIALAMPITVVAMVLVQRLYIEDVLGDRATQSPQPASILDKALPGQPAADTGNPESGTGSERSDRGSGRPAGQAAVSRIDN